MNTQHHNRTTYPILFGFFVMGFVDLVGIATNYVKGDFALSDTIANLLPMMVFIWFAIFSIPTSILMGKIGKKYTVITALFITTIAMLIPLFIYSFMSLLLAFAMIGIGNTILQVSLNPMIASVVSSDKISSTLTLGQFMKAIASFFGPIIAGVAANYWGNWKLTFVLYAIISLFSTCWMYRAIPVNKQGVDVPTDLSSIVQMLKDKNILLLFLGILFIVGIDVGLNTTIPNYLIVQTDMSLSTAGLGTSLYFAFRTAGTFLGALLLTRIKPRHYFQGSMLIAIFAFLFLLLAPIPWVLFASISLLGLACSSVFSILFSYALQHKPDQSNEISALMIMGVSGGALITPLIGLVSDCFGVKIGLSLLLICLLYLGAISLIISSSNKNRKIV